MLARHLLILTAFACFSVPPTTGAAPVTGAEPNKSVAPDKSVTPDAASKTEKPAPDADTEATDTEATAPDADVTDADVTDADVTDAGHSYHGEAFNEGPRQAAHRIAGIPAVDFPTSSESGSAQEFFEQGVGQLHGFWYLEAERSFRQAVSEDPDMAMGYWGLAMANINNATRARGFIDKAMERREKHTDRRERLYIEALDRWTPKTVDDDAKKPTSDEKKDAKRKRTERYIADLEGILHEFPHDVEARAFLVLALWMGDRDGVKLASRYAVDALLGQIFDANPMHPAHHYRIHLWDSKRPENALESAAKCGPSGPGIAHLWHMPGHIYSKLKRYNDAAWQQEASARVDHAQMIQNRLMPDQIHNFAHNNEWLVRNLLHVGRVDDALDLARNLVSLPRHPKYNSLAKGGSYKYGRQRLLQTLTQYGLWDDLLGEAGGMFLVPTDDAKEQEEWMGWLAVAQFQADNGKPSEGARIHRSLQRRKLALQGQLLDLAEPQKTDDADSKEQDDAPESPSRDEIKKHLDGIKKVIARVAAASAARRKDLDAFRRNAKIAKLDAVIEAQWLAQAGDLDEALQAARKAAKSGKGEVRPQAVLVDLAWKIGDKEQALREFEKLRSLAAVADLTTPLLAKLQPVADAAKIEGDWRIAAEPADDLGQRPPLDTLGPFRWRPYASESWGAKMADGTLVAGDQYDGKPHIMIFYLGFGCLHCIEQLHTFQPRMKEFQDMGIDVVALSTESIDELKTGLESFDQEMSIPLMSDSDQHIFRSFRCWDDFEDQPLHGTFLIDCQGKVRWQDIGYEPFNDVDFLLKESKRLLNLP
ncbi:Putative peroxiredoxin/MT2597 [Rubripirellula lacrimiformis]|uniref:Peroxiredoxin/MT2597 n=1 Tax=Rubripirellula lacrimiformis TaxID=1930273 RepID=A0A517NJ16_9BACT|nr:redoxin domain-containing protein [Rubripirellula lacrimiformis]QDT07125.1 Putative peroxiredoxin/MT2597 [Rubripirellula lacrimiformis]